MVQTKGYILCGEQSAASGWREFTATAGDFSRLDQRTFMVLWKVIPCRLVGGN